MQLRADQPENNHQLEFIIKQLHSGQLRPLLLSSSCSYFLWLSFTITIPSLSLYNSEGEETARKNGAGEATARDGADSDVEKADDEFDDEEQDGVEPDLDLNEVVRTEAGERSGERLLIGEFYAPSRPPTAGGAAGGLLNGSRAGSARGNGLMNAGAAGDAPLMLPVTPDARRAAAETFRKEEPAAAAPVPGASSKMEANMKPKTSAAADAVCARAPPPTAGGTEAFSSRPKLPRTPHAGSTSSSRSGGRGTTPRTHGCSNSPPNSPPKPTYSKTLPTSRPGTATRPTSATAANGVNGATKPR